MTYVTNTVFGTWSHLNFLRCNSALPPKAICVSGWASLYGSHVFEASTRTCRRVSGNKSHIKFIRNFKSKWKVTAVIQLGWWAEEPLGSQQRSLLLRSINIYVYIFIPILQDLLTHSVPFLVSLQLPGYLAHTNSAHTIFNIIGSNCRWTCNTKSTVQGHGALYGALQPVC